MKSDASPTQRDLTTLLAGIIVTHGDLARALRDAASEITGDVSHLEALSNDGASLPQLVQRVRQAVAALGGRPCIVFVDFRGGSSANAAVRAVTDMPNTRVLAGVNLPMILDFLLRRADHDLDRMLARLLQRGHNSIQELEDH